MQQLRKDIVPVSILLNEDSRYPLCYIHDGASVPHTKEDSKTGPPVSPHLVHNCFLDMSVPLPLSAINPHDQQHELKLTTSKQSVQAIEYQEENEVTSIFSELGRVQTAKKYWRVSRLQLSVGSFAYNQAVLFCMISALAAAMDGFQTKIPGSIIANRGFINQFGEHSPLPNRRNTDSRNRN